MFRVTYFGRTAATLVWCAAWLCSAAGASGDVTLPSIFSDHMVLQRDVSVPVWGAAEPGERVTVSIGEQKVTTQTDAEGRWRATLAPMKAGGRPLELTIAGTKTIRIKDVLIGEVWICSGQSNMRWRVDQSADAEAEISAADHPSIRMFTVQQGVAPQPLRDCPGSWAVCNPKNVPGFSAVGYFFARALHRKLHVPIGMIHTSWGGTVIEAWTSDEAVRPFREFTPALEELEKERQDPGYIERAQSRAVGRWWRLMEYAESRGPMRGWTAPDFDDSAWKTTEVPESWQVEDLARFDGLVFFRTEVELPEAWAGKALTLELGPIDDMDSTWFNGKRVGGLQGLNVRHTPRRYSVPAPAVRAGRNVVAVRILDIGGGGGLHGKPAQVRVFPTEEGAEAAKPLAGRWRYRKGQTMREIPAFPDRRSLRQNTPTALYNAMLAPVIPYAIRGAIWYQGEANVTRAWQYRRLFPTMIRDWRHRWGQGDFPFYFVQLAPFRYPWCDPRCCAELREAQAMALSLPNTGMAVTMDIGDIRDIHPKNKQDVGKRLALWALAKDYGRDVAYSGPLYDRMEVEGDAIRVVFKQVGTGLITRDGKPPSDFQIAAEDRKFVDARAKIDGDCAVVSAAGVEQPAAVRYAWRDDAEPNLMNKEGLPASPFRTDDWPGVTFHKRSPG